MLYKKKQQNLSSLDLIRKHFRLEIESCDKNPLLLLLLDKLYMLMFKVYENDASQASRLMQTNLFGRHKPTPLQRYLNKCQKWVKIAFVPNHMFLKYFKIR